MCPSCSCFSLDTCSATSPLSTVELFHSGSSRVEETTYLGMLLNLSANSSSRDGHAFAKPSQGTRPGQRRLGVEGLVELELVALLPPAELEAPAAVLVVLGPARVLDDAVE